MKGPGHPDRTMPDVPPQGAGGHHPSAPDLDRTIPAPPPAGMVVSPAALPPVPPVVAAAAPSSAAGHPQAQAYAQAHVAQAQGHAHAAQAAQPHHAGQHGAQAYVQASHARQQREEYPAPPSVFARPPPGARQANPRTSYVDDAVTIEPPTRKHVGPEEQKPLTTFGEIKLILKDFLKKNEKVIWWLHTAYALSLGAFVATFAQKGFEQARMLTVSLAAAWLLVVFFFRFFGTGQQQDFMTAWPGMRRRFFIMSYFMKNLFQGMLFYLLPFYWKSSSYEAKTYSVVIFIGACAILSTLDLVFDRMLLRFKLIASLFFATTLFGCANLVIPALLPNTPVVVTYLVATGLAIATFMLFHLSIKSLKKPVGAVAFFAFIGIGVLAAYSGRRAMPPVPLTLKEAGVGPALRDDGSLSMEVRTFRISDVEDLYAVTDVQAIGKAEHFTHVWRHGKQILKHQGAEAAPAKDKNVVRVASKLDAADLPSNPEGKYTVDVLTDSEQVVGRVVFEIKP